MAADLAVYESWGDLLRKPSEYDDLLQVLRRFSRYSVLWTCSFITVSLRLYEGIPEDFVAYDGLVDHYFSKEISLRLKVGIRSGNPQRLLFHRQQLLHIAKLALKECAVTGLDAAIPAAGFGLVLLMMNDHLQPNVIPSGPILTYERRHHAAFLTEFLATQEFAGHIRPDTAIRAYRMFVEIPQSLTDDPNFIDLGASLYQRTQLTYRQIFAITVGLIARYMTLRNTELQSNGYLLLSHANYLGPLQISQESLARYFALISIPYVQPEKIVEDKGGLRADLSLFRACPLIAKWFDTGTQNQRCGYLPVDIELWWQKIYTAPFWILYRADPNRFSRFWGTVFEEYVHSLLEPCHTKQGMSYIRNPRDPVHNNKEICDAMILQGDSLVLIECKAGLIRADKKYGGDVDSLSKHLYSKFVEDESTGKKKGVFQLAAAVRELFSKGQPHKLRWHPGAIRRCYLLLVTLDDIGDTLSMSPFLESFLVEKLDRQDYPDLEIKPLFCVNVATLERLTTSMKHSPLHILLSRWQEINPLLSTPFSAMHMPDLVSVPDAAARTEWERVMMIAKEELFDEATIAEGEAKRAAESG